MRTRNKTLINKPLIARTLQGQREQTMNATNPIFKALKAAYQELSSPDAIQWYQDTAYQTYLVVGTIATLAVCFVQDWLLEPQEYPVEVPANWLLEPQAEIAGLLMPAKEKVERVLVTTPPLVYAWSVVQAIVPTLEYSGGMASSRKFYRR
jgi:hypothetical protein